MFMGEKMKEKSEESFCFCGSGKQYKDCCLEKIIEFPKNNSSKEIHNYASEVSAAAKAHIESQNLSSLEEVEQELSHFMHNRNTSPIDDFLGIPPSQMHCILHQPFSLSNEIFRFEYGDNFEKNINKIPFLEQALYFLNSLYESGGIKATKKGNLPRAFVIEMYEKFFSKEEFIYAPRKEEDLPEAQKLKYILQDGGLIKKRINKFYITKKGENLIKNKKIKELFDILILIFFNRFNWGAFDYYSELPLIQCGAIFHIHVLNKKANDWVSKKELGEIFIKAFPDIIYDVEEDDPFMFEPKTGIINCFDTRFLNEVCLQWGLLEQKTKEEGMRKINYYRLSPFFKQHFKFKN